MAFDLDNEELRATRKLHKINDDLYEETSDKKFKNDSVIALKFKVIQQQLEQKDKIIQELEKELEKANRQLDLDYVDDNYIPKQKVKDKIGKLRNDLKYIVCDNDCSKCFNQEGKTLYRGSNFIFCYAYHQIKVLQELLEGEK